MAKLFGKNKLREVADKISTEEIQDYLSIIQKWHRDYHKGTLKTDKETSREQAYNQDFFINVLGYKEKPANPYSFEPKATTSAGQLPDAIVGYLEQSVVKDDTKVAAVVELKGAAIVLDKPQRRDGNMSPVQQGFKYKTQYKHCPFVIVSNFYEFRLYQDNQLDYEVWTLDDLVDPADDYFKLKSFYQLLCHKNFVPHGGKGKSKTEELLSDIRIEQEEIGKKFYKAYKQARLELLRDMYKHNPTVKADIKVGIEKAQKIIDRIVFACFAEDRGLLPDNTLQRVLKVDESAFGGLWDTLKGFFNAIDSGSSKLEIPDGYNGGLFATDAELNGLVISDEPLKHLAELSRYDFEEELSVQILGHIFEQSISDLEEIKQKAEEAIGKTEEKITSKRKKDGIFYTPDYIVRYIVESSLGAYLREAEEKCKDEAGLKGDINDKNYGKRERQAYLSYQKILQSVTVCDPACGSGAFLVYVFDYLLAENQRVSAIINPEQSSLLDTDTYFKSILENNIYGVDLNSESVEITKLSLWLKSAQKGKKLTSLNNNIKCGNSLISDSEIAKNKAFKWEDELPEIFDNGGFDVVIGNPPYGATMSDREKEFLEDAYNTYEYQLNSYSLFYERGMHILKDGGVLGFITPANFTYQHYFSNLRSFLQQYTQMSIVKYTYEVFQDADIGDSVSWIIQKSANPKTQIYVSIISHPNEQDFLKAKREYSEIVDARGTYLLSNATVSLKVPVVPLGEITIITVGIKPYQKGKGVPKQTKEDVSEKNYTSTFKVDETYLSCLVGKNFHRYRLLNKPSMYLSYGEWLAEPRKKAPFFDDEKIILRQTADSLIGYLDIEKRIDLNNVYNVGVKSAEFDIKYILGLLNSRFMNFLYQNISQEKGRTFAEVKKNYLIKLPIAEVNAGEQKTITVLVEKILSLNTDRSSSNERFKKLVSTEHIGEKDTERLDQWWTEDFDNLVKRLKVKLSYLQKEDLLELFEKYRDKLIKLDQAIREVDNNIDQQVYKLYNLTAEEIKIVEKS